MKRWMPVLVLGSLLAAALVAAYLSWTADRSAPRMETQIWDLGEHAVRQIRLEQTARTVTLTQEDGGPQGLIPWFDVVSRPGPRPAAPGAEAGSVPAATGAQAASGAPATSPGKVAEEQTGDQATSFRGNARTGDLLEQFGRLQAKRDLGEPGPAQLDEFGLRPGAGRLVVTTATGARSLLLGGEVFGAGLRYVQDEQSKHVFVAQSRAFQDLELAKERLIERDLHAFSPTDPDKVELAAAGQQRVLVRKTSGRPGWAAQDAPDAFDEQAGTWLGKVNRLRIVAYRAQPVVTASVAAAAKAPSPLATLRYFKGGKELGHLTLLRREAEGPPQYVAETEHTAGRQVEITAPLADEVVRELDGMFGRAGAGPPAVGAEPPPSADP